MLEFYPYSPNPDKVTPNNQDIPKEFDIFYKDESEFLPPGKNFGNLTPEEQKLLQEQYQFSYLRPGCYQLISGFRNSA